jgi:sugar phosphate isomerase/epimerase
METGQETPLTLLRVINDINENNLGINFDPANFLMYGKANPIDALRIVGAYVNGVHAKDGEYPTDGISLGVEKPLGKGRVNIELFIQTLFDIQYKGPLTIEREISGEQQKQDVLTANALLLGIIKKVNQGSMGR